MPNTPLLEVKNLKKYFKNAEKGCCTPSTTYPSPSGAEKPSES